MGLGRPSQTAVWPFVMPPLELDPGIFQGDKAVLRWALTTYGTLEGRADCTVSTGLPGRLWSSSSLFQCALLSNAVDVDSVRLSHLFTDGPMVF